MSIVAGSDPNAIERAAQALAAGALVVVPTETVYGLAARADDDRAVMRIFETKGRPKDHPLIVHVAGREFHFAAGEAVRVEYSCKYTDERFAALAARAGLRVVDGWNDARDWFGLRLLQV